LIISPNGYPLLNAAQLDESSFLNTLTFRSGPNGQPKRHADKNVPQPHDKSPTSS
jgi:hypothetical protein